MNSIGKDQDLRPSWARRRLHYSIVVGVAIWGAWLGVWAVQGSMAKGRKVYLGLDFLSFQAAGEIVRSGHPELLYEPRIQGRVQHRLLKVEGDKFVPFVNPPLYAALHALVAALPLPWAYALWTLAGLASLLVAIYWLGAERPLLMFAYAVCFYPVMECLKLGQNSLLTVGILAAVYALLKRRFEVSAGVVAAFLVAKPQLLAGLALWWMFDLRGCYKALVSCLVVACALVAISVACWPEAWLRYLEVASTSLPNWMLVREEGAEYRIWLQYSTRAFWFTLLPGMSTTCQVLTVISWAVGIYWFRAFLKGCSGRLPILFSGALLMTLWLSPHVLVHDWSVLVPVGVLLWEQTSISRDWLAETLAIIWAIALSAWIVTRLQVHVLGFGVQPALFGLVYLALRLRRFSSKGNGRAPVACRTAAR